MPPAGIFRESDDGSGARLQNLHFIGATRDQRVSILKAGVTMTLGLIYKGWASL